MRSRYHSALMLSAALVACGEDTGRVSDIQVQIEDSAGVRIVEYAGVPEVEPPFAIAEEPVYRHGANPKRLHLPVSQRRPALSGWKRGRC